MADRNSATANSRSRSVVEKETSARLPSIVNSNHPSSNLRSVAGALTSSSSLSPRYDNT
ncbi:hypothetical protein F4810DRAFT_671697 [Camillea tinctor]|nr:hypothetical protein F4810DRAFT_671697 [Camillea tinctor]